MILIPIDHQERYVSCFPSFLSHALYCRNLCVYVSPLIPGKISLRPLEVAEVAVTPAPELVEVGCGGVSLSGVCPLGPTFGPGDGDVDRVNHEPFEWPKFQIAVR